MVFPTSVIVAAYTQFFNLETFSSILCNPMDCSTPGLSVTYYLLKFAQVHIHRIVNAIQPYHSLMPSSLSALNLSQHQGLFQ